MTAQLPIPKERLEQILAHCKRETPENMAPISAGSAVEIIGALLAAHEQEPVAYMYRDNLNTDARFSMEPRFGNWSPEDISEYEISETPLYTHPAPVPAVPMAVAGFDAATAIRACMEEFPESMHDIVEECAQIAENTISINHAKSVPVVPKTISVRTAMAALDDADSVTTLAQAYKMGWNDCIAAMLNGGKS